MKPNFLYLSYQKQLEFKYSIGKMCELCFMAMLSFYFVLEDDGFFKKNSCLITVKSVHSEE